MDTCPAVIPPPPLLFFDEAKRAHMVRYFCPGPLKPKFYSVGPPKLLGAIYVATTFKLKRHDSNHNPQTRKSDGSRDSYHQAATPFSGLQ